MTLEAFLSSKPVITCNDSGEPARLVRDGVNGFVTSPDPSRVAAAMESLVYGMEQAAAMGRQGNRDMQSITWEKVGGALLMALGFGRATAEQEAAHAQ